MSSVERALVPAQPIRSRAKVRPLFPRPWFTEHDLVLPNGHPYRVSVAGEGGIPWLHNPGYSATGPVYFQTMNRLVHLVEQGFMVAILDAPGHGGTAPLPRGQSRDGKAYGFFTASVVRDLGFSQLIMSGHSFGGLRSFAAAQYLPKRVKALIDMDAISSAMWDRWVHSLPRQPHRLPGFMIDFLRDGLDTVPWDEYRSGQLQRFGWSTGRAYVRNLAKIGNLAAPGLAIARYSGNEQARQLVRSAGIPVAVLHGTNDRIVAHASGVEAAKQSAGWLVNVEGGGHTWMIKCPDTLAAIISHLWRTPFAKDLRSLDPTDCYEPNALIKRLEFEPDRSHRRPPASPRFTWESWNMESYTQTSKPL